MATQGNCSGLVQSEEGEGGSGWGWGQILRDQWDLSVEEAENSRQPEYISG